MKKHLIIMALAAIAATPVVASSKPNILLFITDDHSVPHLGVDGDENCLKLGITPNIDSFAKEAISFDNAYVTAPHGAPSRVSIFTGLHPVVTGTTRYGQPPQPEIPLFTDILREGGYWVGLSGQDPHLSGDYRADDNSRLQEIYSQLGVSSDQFNSRFDYNGTGETNLVSILEKVDTDKPFFLYYGAKKASKSDSAPQSIGDADRAFGEVIAALKQRDLYDNTIIILIADNGESLPQGKCTLYRGGINVPLIIRYAGSSTRGCVNNALVSSIDLAKTILDFAGLTPTKAMQGETLLPLLKGEKESVRKYAHAQMGWHFNPVAITPDDMYFGRSVTDGETLLIYNAVPRPRMPYFEMYDLVNDKSQQTNIFGDEKYAAKRTELLRAMNRRMVLNGDFIAPPSEFLIIESNMGRKHLGEGNPIP